MPSGIYMILNLQNGNRYIGSAVNLDSRLATHRRQLTMKTHPNRYLQSAWDKYGAEAFSFTPVEAVRDLKNLIAREQFWIDAEKPGYNLAPIAGSCLGVKHSDEANECKSITKSAQTSQRIGHRPALLTYPQRLFRAYQDDPNDDQTRIRFERAFAKWEQFKFENGE